MQIKLRSIHSLELVIEKQHACLVLNQRHTGHAVVRLVHTKDARPAHHLTLCFSVMTVFVTK